jgi:hypothetical protein
MRRLNLKNGKYVFISILLLSSAIFYFFFLRDGREERLIKEGNKLVSKIEYFRAEHNKLPNSLEDIGIEETDGLDVLYYSKKDSTHYIVWFGIDLGESVTYYSDTKTWENHYRPFIK